MQQLLSLSRAARLVGISRGALQRKIRDGGLPTFEGKVRTQDLLAAYPNTNLDQDSELERVEEIKSKAFAKRVRQTMLPDAEVLFTRINEISQDLAQSNLQLNQYRTLIKRLREKAKRWAKAKDDSAQLANDLLHWLDEQLDQGILGEYDQTPLLIQDSILRIVAAQVRIQQSGHDFFVEGADTILEAATHAGLSLPYGCSDGSCGQCRARLISGKVKQTRSYSYHIAEEQQIAGEILLCANTAVSDLVIDVEEVTDPVQMPLQELATTVKSLEFPTRSVMILNLKTPRQRRLRFLAGQSAWVHLKNGARHLLPLASCPCDERIIQFHIPQTLGEFAQQIEQLKGGDEVVIKGPQGHVVLDDESPRTLVFIGQGLGFAPINSLVEHAMALDMADAIHLIWQVNEESGLYLNNLCRAWADALDHFHYHPNVGGDEQQRLQHISGVLQQAGDPSELDVYLCGTESFVRQVDSALLGKGVPSLQIYRNLLDVV